MDDRLNSLIDFIDISDKVIDIGTDHAYVPIALAKRGNTKLLATDVHENALNIAISNIKYNGLENLILTKLSDGLDNIDTSLYDTLVIAGMGGKTIINILNKDRLKLECINKLVIESNDSLPIVRESITNLGYKLKREKVTHVGNHYYVTMEFLKGKSILSEEVKLLGIFNKSNKEYYEYLLNYYNDLLSKVPSNLIDRISEINLNIKYLNEYINNI